MLWVRIILFAASVIALSWYGMMAVHEFGHVIGAWLSGGEVQRVILNPFSISRTDVRPNPSPGIVVWLGPILGCALPVVSWLVLPRRLATAKKLLQFFAGFCLIANGAYIGLGSFERIGDAGQMLQTGTPISVMWLFGVVTVAAGLWLWDRLGPLAQLTQSPGPVSARMAWTAFIITMVVFAVSAIL